MGLLFALKPRFLKLPRIRSQPPEAASQNAGNVKFPQEGL